MDTLNSERCNLAEIKRVLLKHCSSTSLEREIIITPVATRGSKCYFITVEGSPPKGFAIYVYAAERRMLSLYDANGKRFKEYYLESEVDFGGD